MRSMLAIALGAAVTVVGGCSGTTGSGLVTFTAQAGGPSSANGGTLEFDTGSGYHVSLTMAQFHLGAVYLNMSVPSSGGPEEPCILPGIYVAQAFGTCDTNGSCGLGLDLLSSAMMTFPLPGEGTENPAVEAEVWLTSGDINATEDPVPVMVTAGTATKGTQIFPFSATVTIGSNRQLPVQNPAMPGSNPICRQRIVSLIPVSLTLTNGGTLALRVDPGPMFDGVDFASLTAGSDGSYVIPDTQGGVGGAFFKGVTSTAPYQFSYTAAQAQ